MFLSLLCHQLERDQCSFIAMSPTGAWPMFFHCSVTNWSMTNVPVIAVSPAGAWPMFFHCNVTNWSMTNVPVIAMSPTGAWPMFLSLQCHQLEHDQCSFIAMSPTGAWPMFFHCCVTSWSMTNVLSLQCHQLEHDQCSCHCNVTNWSMTNVPVIAVSPAGAWPMFFRCDVTNWSMTNVPVIAMSPTGAWPMFLSLLCHQLERDQCPVIAVSPTGAWPASDVGWEGGAGEGEGCVPQQVRTPQPRTQLHPEGGWETYCWHRRSWHGQQVMWLITPCVGRVMSLSPLHHFNVSISVQRKSYTQVDSLLTTQCTTDCLWSKHNCFQKVQNWAAMLHHY